MGVDAISVASKDYFPIFWYVDVYVWENPLLYDVGFFIERVNRVTKAGVGSFSDVTGCHER